MEQEQQRFGVSASAGQRDGRGWAVMDRHDHQGGKGMRRVSFHRTFSQAQQRAKAMNRKDDRRSNTFFATDCRED